MTLKGQFTQKWKLCHHLLTPKLFLSCMNCFLLLNTIYNDILKKVGNQLPVATDFHSFFQSQWLPATVWLPTFFKISSFEFNRRKKLIQVRNNLRVSKWWQMYLTKIIKNILFCIFLRIYIYIYIHYIAKSIGSPPFNERFDYFSNFHEYKS